MIILLSLILDGSLSSIVWMWFRFRKGLQRAAMAHAAVSGLVVGIARTHKKTGQFTIPGAVVDAIPDWVVRTAPNPNGSIKVQVMKVGK